MAAKYPDSVYVPRPRANKSGVVYDENKKTTLFKEDFENSDNEIIAIENELGYPPAGYKRVIGDYDGGNYVGIKDDGKILLFGTARVIRHVILDAKRFKMPAANFPGESFEGLFYTLDFDKGTEQNAYGQEHVPFRWAEGTDVEIAIDWLHDGVDAGVVVWGIEYKAIKAGEVVVGAGTTITKTSAGNHAAGQLVRTAFTSKILGSNLEADDILAFRLFRKAADGADTLDEDARTINVHFHFIKDKLGKAT